jgi:hypothetical protein
LRSSKSAGSTAEGGIISIYSKRTGSKTGRAVAAAVSGGRNLIPGRNSAAEDSGSYNIRHLPEID